MLTAEAIQNRGIRWENPGAKQYHREWSIILRNPIGVEESSHRNPSNSCPKTIIDAVTLVVEQSKAYGLLP